MFERCLQLDAVYGVIVSLTILCETFHQSELYFMRLQKLSGAEISFKDKVFN